MEFIDILIFGAGAVSLGLLVLGAMIVELRLKVGRPGLVLGIGLGTGILAFTAKLGLIVAYSYGGEQYLASTLPHDLKPEPFSYETNAVDGSSWATYQWQPLPSSPPIPADNPMTPEKVALGKLLFHDARLSYDGSVSCASCHKIDTKGGADGLPVSVGISEQKGGRNAPTVLNAAYQAVLFWDGRASSLEEQAKGPLINPVEMGMPDLDSVVSKVENLPEYQTLFAQVFGGSRPVTIDNIAKAIASYERTLITPDSAYDRFVKGDHDALTPQQIRGMGLFASFGCIQCHRGPNFSDAALVGGNAPFRAFPAVQGTEYEERYQFTEDKGLVSSDNSMGSGIWRIPSLRNVTRTAPYFHNGSVNDLEEAVRVMARVQLDTPNSNSMEDDWLMTWEPETSVIRVKPNAVISDSEVKDIVAFLHALEGTVAPEVVLLAENSNSKAPGKQ